MGGCVEVCRGMWRCVRVWGGVCVGGWGGCGCACVCMGVWGGMDVCVGVCMGVWVGVWVCVCIQITLPYT